MNKKSFFGQTVVGPVCVLFSFAVTLFLASDGLAQTQGTGFKQAVAEAALTERELADYYRDTGYVPVWVDPVAGQARRQALFEAMARAPMHGLPPSRYDAGALYEELQAAQTSRDLGYAEVAMSRMFVKLARDMQTGLLQPRAAHSSIKRDVVPSTPAALLSGFAEAEPRAFLRSLNPPTTEYRQLMRQKIQLEETVARGGWGPSGPGKALKPGATGAAVVRLRDRLMAMGYLHRTATASYDTAMESAVR
ncbi:MAG: murein L,D-transpeptidase, partial [Pseudomonadota bacterium]